MANAMPWSVRGIDPDIREQAVEAAHRSGLSVGQWLNHILSDNLEPDDDELQPRSRMTRRPRKTEDLDQRLARIGRSRSDTALERFPQEDDGQQRMIGLLESAVSAIERLETGRAKPMAEPQAPKGDDLLQAFRALEARVQSLSSGTVAASGGHIQASQGSPRGAMSRASRQLEDDDPAFSAAIAEIEARRRELDGHGSGPVQRGQGRGAPGASRRAEEPRHLEEMRQQLDQLVSRIDDMRREQKPDSARLQDRIETIAQRIEDWRNRPNEDVALIRRDLASLGAAIEALTPNRLVGMVESAVATVAERTFRASRDPLPERLLGAFDAMQEDIRTVLQAVSSARGTDRVTQEIGIVARRLEEIGRISPDFSRIDDIMREAEAIKALIGEAMRAQPLGGLAHQIEALGKEIERFRQAPAGNSHAVIDAIHDVRDRVERIDPAATFAGLEQRLQAIAAIETRLGALAGIEQKLDTIARDVSKIAKDAKPLPQLDSIAERLERIDRVLDGSRDQPLAGLGDLAEKLDRIGLTLEKAGNAAPQEALVGLLQQLSERMESVQASQSDSRALDALHDEIARLGRKLEETAPGMPGLDGIERQVGDLLAQFDSARQDISRGAAEAAEKAARDAIKSIARDDSGDTLAAEGLLLLKRDLGEFKSQHGESDRRTRQTLEALHGTLEAVAARLAQIETARAQPSMDVPAQRHVPSPPAVSAPPQQPAAPRQPAPTSMLAAARGTVAPDDDHPEFSDLPLEPGMVPGANGSIPQRSGMQEGTGSSDPRANFIAAARRAAQAAAQESQDALTAEAQEKAGKGPAAALRSLMARKPKTEQASGARRMPTAGSAHHQPSFLIRQRRPILLGLAALIFALGALKVLRGSGERADLPVSSPVPSVEDRLDTRPKSPPVSVPAPETELTKPEKRSEAEPKPAQPERTAGIAPLTATGPNGETVIIPTLTPPQTGVEKRSQRLAEASAISQADPITVGSITQNGSEQPISTGRQAITELVATANLKGQDALQKAALSGNSAALFEIGSRFADGRGMAREPKMAARWFEQAAAQGHGPSQYRLASLYREGRGVPKDPALAFQWFDRAAAQGHVLAMHNAAVLLAEGVHGAPDYAGAALWFKRAAEHGVKDSQFNIAILFARGLGVNQDLVEAYRWFSAAAAQGDKDAVKKRDDLGARLTKDQLAKQRDWLKSFKPTPANPIANEAGSWTNTAQSALQPGRIPPKP